jgi:hypothetical protein
MQTAARQRQVVSSTSFSTPPQSRISAANTAAQPPNIALTNGGMASGMPPAQGNVLGASSQPMQASAPQATMPQGTMAQVTAPVGAAPPAAGQPAGREPALASETTAQSAPENPDDYAPATDPGPPTPLKGHVRRSTESGLPLYQDAAAAPGSNLPQLRLDLHVYAARPQERFALINMHKLHEGDSLPDGIRVDSITPDGVVMSHNGAQFLLPRD